MRTRDFVENYYYRSISGLAPSTIAGYKSTVEMYVLPRFGETDLDDITALDVEEWLSTIGKAGAAEKAYKMLRQIIRKAKDYDEYNGNDPTTKHIKVPRTRGYEPKVLNAKEVQQLLEAFEGHYLEPNVICAVMLGLRRGEAFGLKWEDIDLRSGKVSVRRSFQSVNGSPMFLPTKTVKSTRTCILPQFARDRMRVIGKRKKGMVCGDANAIPDKMARDYKKRCEETGCPFTSFTNLRHTWATLALEGGADIATVASMLGHTDISTAYNHYLKPRKEHYKNAQAGVQKLVRGK